MVYSDIIGPMKINFYVEPPYLWSSNFIPEIWVECSTWLPCSQMLKHHLQNWWAKFHEAWYAYLGLQPIVVCSNYSHRMTSTNFTARSVLETTVCTWKKRKQWICSPKPKSWQKLTLNESMQLIKVTF